MAGRGSGSAAPLSAEAFAASMARLHESGPLALAVSGGGDSMALMALAAEWGAGRSAPLLVLTVDHGLRPGSAGDAAFVETAARALGLPVRRFEWPGPKPQSGLQAAAREARYRLMAAACREAGIGTLALAHSMDDQAETVLMRLARGAGVDGLSAMAPSKDLYGLRLIRPLLGVSRDELRAVLRARGLAWREDPSNENLAFERVRARQTLAQLAPLGLDAEALARTASRMAEAREALDAAAAGLAARAAEFEPLGYVRLNAAPMAAAPLETALRLLSATIRWVSGAAYAPGREELERALDWISSAPEGGGRTLHGCQFDARDGAVTLSREFAAATEEIPAPTEPFGDAVIWDGRFHCHCWDIPASAGLRIAALGPDGARQVKEWGDPPEEWVRAPRAAKLSSPALWSGDKVESAAFAGSPLRFDGPWLSALASPYPFPLKGSGERLC